jgi:thioredoxin-related protein
MSHKTLLTIYAIACALLLFAPLSCAKQSKAAKGSGVQAPSAQTLLDAAMKKAKAEHKAVFVIFGASGCGWCNKLDAFLEQPDIQQQFAAHYVIVHLVVNEDEEKKHQENPGGKEVMKKLGAEQPGIPFYAFLDATGKKLADSNVLEDGYNIGYPGTPEGIEAFVGLLKKTAPKMKSADLEKLIVALKKNAPKQL